MGKNNPSVKDAEMVIKTFKFFGRQLLLQKFILKAILKKKEEAEAQEKACKEDIKQLLHRINREIDANPEIFKKQPEKEG